MQRGHLILKGQSPKPRTSLLKGCIKTIGVIEYRTPPAALTAKAMPPTKFLTPDKYTYHHGLGSYHEYMNRPQCD